MHTNWNGLMRHLASRAVPVLRPSPLIQAPFVAPFRPLATYLAARKGGATIPRRFIDRGARSFRPFPARTGQGNGILNAGNRIDLRSDILTRPTEAMIQAMTAAARQPQGFGLREDTHVQRLESEVAELLGMEDALLCPTCTQANQIAINVHCRPGQRVITEATSHIVTSEAGAPAALSGVTLTPIPGTAGKLDPGRLCEQFGPTDPLRSSVGLVWLENTHVRSGGRVLSNDYTNDVARHARAHGVRVHLDGARLTNAAVAQEVSLSELAAAADSVSLSLNKGLGAPLGAVLAGRRDFIAKAETIRQRWGGGWRPAGIVAAAGLAAFEDWSSRLGQDHARARMLASGLASLPRVRLDTNAVETNLVLVEVEGMSGADVVNRLTDRNILALAVSDRTVRLALYHDIDDASVVAAVDRFEDLIAKECQ